MNIAHILAGSITLPLTTHNGRYEWVLRLAKAQAKQGHTVTLYCGGGAIPEAPDIHIRQAPGLFGNSTVQTLATLKFAMQNPEHDVIHSHVDYLHYLVADSTDKPIIFTEHWFPNQTVSDAVQYNTRGNVVAVPVTHYMHHENEKLQIPSAGTIYHGIDLQKFAFADKQRSDRFVFVGRIAPHKGVSQIVTLARQAGIALDIVGKINDKDQAYWQSIEPYVDGQHIRYLGAKSHDEVVAIFAEAKALLFTPQTIEAFGQTIIEAQACGTPVITNNLGAARELVQHGKTGFVAATEQELLAAVRAIDSINPADCRAFAEQFDFTTMVAVYDDLYKSLARPRAKATVQHVAHV